MVSGALNGQVVIVFTTENQLVQESRGLNQSYLQYEAPSGWLALRRAHQSGELGVVLRRRCTTCRNDEGATPTPLTWSLPRWPRDKPVLGTATFSDQTALLRCIDQDEVREVESEIF